jgi:hypothetical protein
MHGEGAARRGARPPHVTTAAWWIAYVLLFAAFVAWMYFA